MLPQWKNSLLLWREQLGECNSLVSDVFNICLYVSLFLTRQLFSKTLVRTRLAIVISEKKPKQKIEHKERYYAKDNETFSHIYITVAYNKTVVIHFWAFWLVRLSWNILCYSLFWQNKNGGLFPSLTEDDIHVIDEATAPTNTKKATQRMLVN